ncbi:MAG: hypothetical protein F6K16_23970, partial [Symploca sp. SIO2B6]|nr:hypothetical protein [Symploca sp. SIO2B6]
DQPLALKRNTSALFRVLSGKFWLWLNFTSSWDSEEVRWICKRAGIRRSHLFNYFSILRLIRPTYLAKYAKDKYDKLTSEEQEQAQRIFVQLVYPDQGNKHTRRRANRAELGEDNWHLVTCNEGLADSRLVVTSVDDVKQETVEIVHEALIQNWDDLQKWIENDRKFRTWQEGLRFAIRQWQQSGKDQGALLRGRQLFEAEDWLQRRRTDLEAEREYIEVSVEERNVQIQRELKWTELELKLELDQVKRDLARRTMFGALGVLIGLVGVFYYFQAEEIRFQSQLTQIIIEGGESLDSLKFLPKVLRRANRTASQQNIDEAIGLYQKTITAAQNLKKAIIDRPQEFHPQVKNKQEVQQIWDKAESSLVEIVLKHRFPQLEEELKNGRFGRYKTYKKEPDDEEKATLFKDECDKFHSETEKTISTALEERCQLIEPTDFKEKHTDGALKTTYKILITSYGIGADLDKNGQINNPYESERMPCEILKKIEELWRKYTDNRCGWLSSLKSERDRYIELDCQVLNQETLISSTISRPYWYTFKRVTECQKKD